MYKETSPWPTKTISIYIILNHKFLSKSTSFNQEGIHVVCFYTVFTQFYITAGRFKTCQLKLTVKSIINGQYSKRCEKFDKNYCSKYVHPIYTLHPPNMSYSINLKSLVKNNYLFIIIRNKYYIVHTTKDACKRSTLGNQSNQIGTKSS
jgi:hypothetical protein